jgi:hypothetical protein
MARLSKVGCGYLLEGGFFHPTHTCGASFVAIGGTYTHEYRNLKGSHPNRLFRYIKDVMLSRPSIFYHEDNAKIQVSSINQPLSVNDVRYFSPNGVIAIFFRIVRISSNRINKYMLFAGLVNSYKALFAPLYYILFPLSMLFVFFFAFLHSPQLNTPFPSFMY